MNKVLWEPRTWSNYYFLQGWETHEQKGETSPFFIIYVIMLCFCLPKTTVSTGYIKCSIEKFSFNSIFVLYFYSKIMFIYIENACLNIFTDVVNNQQSLDTTSFDHLFSFNWPLICYKIISKFHPELYQNATYKHFCNFIQIYF